MTWQIDSAETLRLLHDNQQLIRENQRLRNELEHQQAFLQKEITYWKNRGDKVARIFGARLP